jgi:hypothetical protein
MPALVDHRHAQGCGPVEAIGRADACQERERLGVAAGEDVLAVVDPITGDGVAKRIGASTESGSGFEDVDRQAVLRERGRRREPGEPAANYRDQGFGIRD